MIYFKSILGLGALGVGLSVILLISNAATWSSMR